MVTTDRLQMAALRIWLDANRQALPMGAKVALEAISSGRPDIWAVVPEMASLCDGDRRDWLAGVRAAAEAMREAAEDWGDAVPMAARVALAQVPE